MELKKALTEDGKLYLVKHEARVNIYNADCLEYMKTIPDKTVNMVLMDPPYNIKKDKDWDNFKTVNAYVEFMGKVFKECERVLVDNGTMYWFHNDIEQVSHLKMWLNENTSFRYNSFIVLNKGDWRALSWKNPTDNNKLRCWFNTLEFCNVYVKGDCLHTEWDRTGWDKVRLDVNNFSSLRKYAYDMLCFIGGGTPQTTKYINKQLGHRKAEHFFYCGQKEYL